MTADPARPTIKTYALYLLIFPGAPLLMLAALHLHRGHAAPGRLPWMALLLHMLIAVVYTTPWDNYLVATGVWWYDPARVIGVTLGWVPIEEYTFFVVQTLMTGMWLLWLRRGLAALPSPHLSPSELEGAGAPSPLRGEGRGEGRTGTGWRWRPWIPGLLLAGALAVPWCAATAIVLAGWQPGAYLALELAWFLPPIILQIIVGCNILWQQRQLVVVALLPPILYLAATDAVAIAAGVWTINPQQTLGLLLGGVLPIEEIVFFALTNTLIVFGMVLVITVGQRGFAKEETSH